MSDLEGEQPGGTRTRVLEVDEETRTSNLEVDESYPAVDSKRPDDLKTLKQGLFASLRNVNSQVKLELNRTKCIQGKITLARWHGQTDSEIHEKLGMNWTPERIKKEFLPKAINKLIAEITPVIHQKLKQHPKTEIVQWLVQTCTDANQEYRDYIQLGNYPIVEGVSAPAGATKQRVVEALSQSKKLPGEKVEITREEIIAKLKEI